MPISPHATLPADMQRIAGALADRFADAGSLPFSFLLGDERISGIPARFAPTMTRRLIDANLTELRYVGTDPATGLRIELEALAYRDYPVYEWTLWLENTGSADTPVISDVRGGDVTLAGVSPVLHHGTGDHCTQENFETVVTPLTPGTAVHLEPIGGRPCDGCFPYLRVLFDGWGVNLAIGWPAQWSADLRGCDGGCAVQAGQQHFHACLQPGERVRGPRLCVMAFEGDVTRAANLWRRWYFAHVMPRRHGAMIGPQFVLTFNGGGVEYVKADEANQLEAMAAFAARGYRPDIWWIDAGWYPCRDEDGENQWPQTGSWEPDPARFPRGLRPVGDQAADWGADFLLWYEPERVRPGSRLAREHPEWLLSTEEDPGNYLLNLTMPDCADWLIEHVDGQIKEFGLKIYRQDFNFNPLPFWRTGSADRLGITENLHVQQYLRFWDELLLRNPGLLIDSCASGGRRNDLESMRRSVPLHFTDYGYGNFPMNQAMYHTMFSWIPYFRGLGFSSENPDGTYSNQFTARVDGFALLNALTPGFATFIQPDADPALHALLQQFLPVWRVAAEITLQGDFYPLTPYSKANDAFYCTQFDIPEEGRGFLQLLAMPACPGGRFAPRPYVHVPDGAYRFSNPLTGETRCLAGAELASRGFEVALERRSGAVWFYTVEGA